MPEFCKTERTGHIFTVTINRPEARNALNMQARRELNEVFDEFARNDSLWVAILTGSGDKAFSAGDDLKEAKRLVAGLGDRIPDLEVEMSFAGVTNRFDLLKPVIAAVNGVAYGGGFEAALACDIILASEHATFALSEARLGVAPIFGGASRLVQQIGYRAAMGIILTGRPIPATEAKELGLVNEVVPLDRLMDAAHEWAEQIVKCAPLAIQASKEMALMAMGRPVHECMFGQAELQASDAVFRSADLREGLQAYFEKRSPRWEGQ